MSSSKTVFFFGPGKADGNASLKNLLGGKGANLAEMSNLGIPVPAGMTIATTVCERFYENKNRVPRDVMADVMKTMKKIEKVMGKKFGDVKNPLLFSVRSGARVSMPGMMDTVLNLGLNDNTLKGLIQSSGNERFAYDSYRRFIQMYGDVVLEVEHDAFETLLEKVKAERGVTLDTDLDSGALKELVESYKKLVKEKTGNPFPVDPVKQLEMAIAAVFKSWKTTRAVKYRNLHDIPHHWGTAVNVQSMVYGNLGDTSGTGVCFTRNPSTGERKLYGEYLMNAQGEDVVAGIRTPKPIEWLKQDMPRVYGQLERIYQRLEKHYKEMQDLEFTIENGTLYLLQTRSGKRTVSAAVRIAVEMVAEKLIKPEDAVMRIQPQTLDRLLHPMIDPDAPKEVLGKGLPASPGAAVGEIVFTADDAEAAHKDGRKCLLLRRETSPEDIGGMAVAQGILTSRGGMTSHAAVVARGMGTPCVAGCDALVIDMNKRQCRIGGEVLNQGDTLTIDGATGEVLKGSVGLKEPELSGHLGKLMKWADGCRTMNVRTNADTPKDAQKAIEFGAEGIGLCRTEHMFFEGQRIEYFREMILARDEEGRRRALDKLLPIQREDFIGIFSAMSGLPVTVRLLDPPLHEFLPQKPEEIAELARNMNLSVEDLNEKISSLHEFNPMMGHRGCRLGITFPEIYDMQVRAIVEAALEAHRRGKKVLPEIMIPLVGAVKELKMLKDRARSLADSLIKASGIRMKYLVGTMIEIPRAALLADQIALEAEFFSFGTNDLTQMTFGFSRDDAGSFLDQYVREGILEKDPFQVLDVEGVGKLVQTAATLGRSANKNLKLGICGEHGGEPTTVEFCHRVGLNYVSCSPYRVPIARLSAAQAAIRNKVSKSGKKKAVKKK